MTNEQIIAQYVQRKRANAYKRERDRIRKELEARDLYGVFISMRGKYRARLLTAMDEAEANARRHATEQGILGLSLRGEI